MIIAGMVVLFSLGGLFMYRLFELDKWLNAGCPSFRTLFKKGEWILQKHTTQQGIQGLFMSDWSTVYRSKDKEKIVGQMEQCLAGEKLRDLRIGMRLSKHALARILKTSVRQLTAIENGVVPLNLEQLRIISKKFGISLA